MVSPTSLACSAWESAFPAPLSPLRNPTSVAQSAFEAPWRAIAARNEPVMSAAVEGSQFFGYG